MNNSIYTPHIRVPKAYDLAELAERFLTVSGLHIPLVRAQDSIALILFHVHHRWLKQRKKGKVGRSGMVPFHVDQRRQLIGRNQDKYFSFLVEEGILSSNDNPIAGVSATKFRLRFPRGKYQWENYTVTDGPSIRRLNSLQQEASELRYSLAQGVSSLAQVMDLPVVSFDPSHKERIKQLQEEDLRLAVSEDDINNIRDKYKLLKQEIALIQQGDFSFMRDTSGYRLHSRIVRLRKELRPYILINNEPADEVDIKNSQPFFMLTLTRPTLWTPGRIGSFLHITDLDKNLRLGLGYNSKLFWDVQNVIEGNTLLTTAKFDNRRIVVEGETMEVSVKKRYSSILLLAVYLSNHDEPTGLNFLSLARTGTIYDVLTTEFKGKFFDEEGNDLLADRDKTKLTVLEELFSDPSKLRFKGRPSVLASLFPNLFLFTKLLKERGYKNFSLLLQRVEAALFLEGALESFLQRHPLCGLLSVHDSALVPRPYASRLKKHVEDYIGNAVGAQPICTVKRSVAQPQPVYMVTADNVTPPYMQD